VKGADKSYNSVTRTNKHTSATGAWDGVYFWSKGGLFKSFK